MRYLEIGGARLSVIGLGTWQFGSREWGYGEDFARTTAPAIVRRALELGVNVFDTAESYGLGRSERILGSALDGRRGDAFVATKLMPVLPLPRIVDWRARASAARLGVETLDLYQLHWPNPLVPPRTTMRGMRRLIDAGLVRHAGVSNYSLEGWRVAERVLGRPVLSNQVRFSLAQPGPQMPSQLGPSRNPAPSAAGRVDRASPAADRAIAGLCPHPSGLRPSRLSRPRRAGRTAASSSTPT